MSIYKKAARLGLTIKTSKGLLRPYQLFNLSLRELDQLAVSLDDQYKASNTKSFLDNTKSKKDKMLKLQFDIVLDVLETLKTENEGALEEKAKKEHNATIDAIIAMKQKNELQELSIEELQKRRM